MEDKKRPRILFVLHSYFNRGGTEEHTKLLVQSLAGKFDTYIVFPHEEQLVLLFQGRPIKTYPAAPFEWPKTPARSPVTEGSMLLLLKELSPDICHIQHFFRWPLGILELIADTVKKTVLTLHDYYALSPDFTLQTAGTDESLTSNTYSQRVFGAELSDYLKWRRGILEKALHTIPKIVVPSPFLQRFIKAQMGVDTEVVEHGIEVFQPLPRARQGSLTFGYFGAAIPQKGYASLLRGFQVASERVPNIELRMYGFPPDSYEPLGNVTFHPGYERTDLPQVLSSADIGVIPSLFRETYCLLLSEMWQAKMPVIAADIGALSDRVVEDQTGKKFSPGSAESIAEAITWFVENSSWRAWKFPKPRTAAEMGNAYRDLYESL